MLLFENTRFVCLGFPSHFWASDKASIREKLGIMDSIFGQFHFLIWWFPFFQLVICFQQVLKHGAMNVPSPTLKRDGWCVQVLSILSLLFVFLGRLGFLLFGEGILLNFWRIWMISDSACQGLWNGTQVRGGYMFAGDRWRCFLSENHDCLKNKIQPETCIRYYHVLQWMFVVLNIRFPHPTSSFEHWMPLKWVILHTTPDAKSRFRMLACFFLCWYEGLIYTINPVDLFAWANQ